jgi:hypothetical protein
MSDDANDGFSFKIGPPESLVPAITGLAGALQVAMELVVFPQRLEIDEGAPSARLDRLMQQLLQCVKNLSTEGLSESDEAAGLTIAIRIIDELATRLRRRIGQH